MAEKASNSERKPKYDRLSKPVQVLLKDHEFKILDRVRRESPFPTNAAYIRYLILENIKKKNQTELLP
jgi:hypothetical protein